MLHFPIPNPRSLIPDPQSPIPDPQSPIPDPQSPIPNPRSPIPDALTKACTLFNSSFTGNVLLYPQSCAIAVLKYGKTIDL